MTDETFVTFQKFNEKIIALQLGELLDENSIEYVIEDSSATFDPFSNNEFAREFRIKLRKSDLKKQTA